MPIAQIVELQRNTSLRTVNAKLAADENVAGGKGPWEWLVDKVGFWPAAGIVGTAIAVPIATSSGGGGGSSSP